MHADEWTDGRPVGIISRPGFPGTKSNWLTMGSRVLDGPRERELQWIVGQLHIDEFTFIIAIRRGWDGYGIIGRASPYSVGSHWLLCTLNYFPYYSHLFAIIHNNPVTPSHSVEIGVLLLITLLKVIVFQEMPFYCRLIDSHDFSSSGTGWLSWVFFFCVLSQLSVESE